MADSAPAGLVLRGRRDECAVIDRLLHGAVDGRSGVLLVRGEAGVGKTALLEYAIGWASDMTVLRAVGVESEMELPFAALHQLCAPMLDRLERLPSPQRDALRTTFGLSAGAAPDRFLIGLATLSLLAEVAEERALLCVVDDGQWLDHASVQALAFAARRLLAERVVMLFAAREPSGELTGLPELVVEGVRDADARAILGSVIPGRLDERGTDQLVAGGGGGRGGDGPARGRGGRQPVGFVGASARAFGGAAGGRVRLAGSGVAVGEDRGELPPAVGGSAGGHPAAVAVGRGGADRGSGGPVACGRAARDHRPGARAGGVGRADRNRRPGAVSPSAGAFGRVSSRNAAGAAAGPSGLGRRDRRAGRSGPARLAPDRGRVRP